MGSGFLNLSSRIKNSGGFCLTPSTKVQVSSPRIYVLCHDPGFCYQFFGGSRFQDSDAWYLVEHSNKDVLSPATLHLLSLHRKLTLGPQTCDCTQEGVDQGADGTQGFEEELWQLVFSSAGVFCQAAHLHWASVGSGGGTMRHCNLSEHSDPRQAPLPE